MAIIGIVLLYGCSEGNIKQQSLEDIAGNVIKEVSEPYSGSDAGGKLQSGKSIVRSLRKKEIEFSDNITIGAKLYTIDGYADIRPYEATFTKADLSFE